MSLLMDAARQHRVELANGQRRLPLLPAGAPAPRPNPHALPRALAPGFRKSQPAPLSPEPEAVPRGIAAGRTLAAEASAPLPAPGA